MKSFHLIVGSNKRLAKNAAAATALNKLRNVPVTEETSQMTQQYISSEEQEKADMIGR